MKTQLHLITELFYTVDLVVLATIFSVL